MEQGCWYLARIIIVYPYESLEFCPFQSTAATCELEFCHFVFAENVNVYPLFLAIESVWILLTKGGVPTQVSQHHSLNNYHRSVSFIPFYSLPFESISRRRAHKFIIITYSSALQHLDRCTVVLSANVIAFRKATLETGHTLHAANQRHREF